MRFEDLRLAEPILRAVQDAGYTTPTPIQSKAIPVVLEGRDVLGCAQTGTGKTAAFALPVLQGLLDTTPMKLTADADQDGKRPAFENGGEQGSSRRSRAPRRRRRPIRALVVCPTRELAQQIFENFECYSAHTPFRAVAIFGGVSQNRQVRALRDGCDILIATPGRLQDLMGQKLLSIGDIEYFVLDEADRMLDMGFMPDIRRIIEKIPAQRQSLLFSATMPPPIRKLANDLLRNPVSVQVAAVSSAAETVSHSVYHVEKPQKMPLLAHLLREADGSRALVFTRTKHGADRLARRLHRTGIPAAALHGNKSQNARTRALDEFRNGKTPVLIATDIAARGIDVDDITQVINFDLTPEPETYVHRIGRTGRAGAAGMAISFCSSEDRSNLQAIEKLLRQRIEQQPVPKLAAVPADEPPQRSPSRPTGPKSGNRSAASGAGSARSARAAGSAGSGSKTEDKRNRGGSAAGTKRRRGRRIQNKSWAASE